MGRAREICKYRRRRIEATLAVTALALLTAASPAAAATTVGQSSLAFSECGDNYRYTMESTGPPPAYTIPFDGVITSFTSYDVAGGEQEVKLLVLDGSGSTYTATAKSQLAIFPSPGLHTFQTSLPARTGQRIGLYGSFCHAFTDNTQDVARSEQGQEPALGVPMSYATQNPSFRIILSAELEPDADRDGFGDESQDRCPTEASATGGPCQRTVTFDAKKRKVEKGRKVGVQGDVNAPANVAGCEASQTVEILRDGLKRGAPQVVATLTTDAQGGFSMKLKLRKTSLLSARAPETAACQAGSSSTEKVRVKKKK